MSDLISMEAALYAANTYDYHGLAIADVIKVTDGCANVIEKLPAVDAEPVRRGRWVEDPNRRNHWHCSECKDVWGIVSRVMNYCPKCGAKMDGVAGDKTTTEEKA